MSDTGRKPMSEQLGDKIKPESQKSTTEAMRDKSSGMMDRAAGAVQPESQKSSTQKMGDSTRGSEGKGMVESVKDTMQSAKENVGLGADKK
ncbi:heat shock protein 9/12-domain-containing protein [Kalaharituber pfeilii]|nr:heat shock protein 9/12-domain-containing protein [Kalaharituber pfeilii]